MEPTDTNSLVQAIERLTDVYAQAVAAPASQFWPTLLGVVAGATLTFGARLLINWIERGQRRLPERMLLREELADMKRHFQANVRILNKILSGIEANMRNPQGELMPSPVHFEKLKVPEDLILFRAESLRLLETETVENIFHLKMKLRNRTLEAQYMVDYLKTGKYDVDIMKAYVNHLIMEQEDIQQPIQRCIDQLPRPPQIPKAEGGRERQPLYEPVRILWVRR